MNIIPITELSSRAFESFGKVFDRGDRSPLAETAAFSFWNDLSRFDIDGEVEIGWCDVRAQGESIDWFERHDRTPEVLIPVRNAIILPVMTSEGIVEAFVIEPGQAVVIERGVWHSACQPAGSDETGYVVIFRRGTPAEDVIKTEVGPFSIEAATASGR